MKEINSDKGDEKIEELIATKEMQRTQKIYLLKLIFFIPFITVNFFPAFL
ncbi:MAG: hypothetical protein ACOYK6_06015 [Chthoniobacterales bacterium]